MVQTVKNLPAMQETQVQSLGRKNSWRWEWLPTPVFLPRGQRSLVDYSPWGRKESDKRTIYYNFSKRHLSQGDCHLLDFCSNRLLISVIMVGQHD